MKIKATNIIYDEHTREWNISKTAIKTVADYYGNENADHSVWSFGELMDMNNELPTEVVVDVPYKNFMEHIYEIDELVKAKIKEQTSRDVKSVMLEELHN